MADFPFPERDFLLLPLAYNHPHRTVALPGGAQAILVRGHADVRTVLSDDRFCRDAGVLFARERRSLGLVASDPPDHTRRRRTITAEYTKRRADQLEPELVAFADELLDGLASPADLVAGFAIPFPLTVMCHLLDVPVQDAPRLREWGEAMMSTYRFSTDQVADAHQQMREYFAGHVEVDDMSELSRDEQVALAAGMFIAGYETTANQLAICLYLLLRDDELMARARDSASLPALVDEMLRWTSFMSTGGPPHVATEDVPLSEGVVRAGQVVVPLLDAANRDPAVFVHPDRIVPDRERNPHVAFGYGRHRCPGAHLARAELRIGVERVLDRLPRLRLAVGEDELRWRKGMFVRGLWELPVRWGASC